MKKIDIKNLFKYLIQNAGQMTDSQLMFFKSVEKYFRENKTISEKQLKCILELKKYVSNYHRNI
jgi:hypothetical protein